MDSLRLKWTLNTHCCVNLWALKNTSSLQLLFQVLPKGSSSSLHLLLHSRQSNFQIKLLHFSMSKHCNWEKLTQNWPCICLILQVLIILSLLHFEYIFLLSNHIAAQLQLEKFDSKLVLQFAYFVCICKKNASKWSLLLSLQHFSRNVLDLFSVDGVRKALSFKRNVTAWNIRLSTRCILKFTAKNVNSFLYITFKWLFLLLK